MRESNKYTISCGKLVLSTNGQALSFSIREVSTILKVRRETVRSWIKGKILLQFWAIQGLHQKATRSERVRVRAQRAHELSFLETLQYDIDDHPTRIRRDGRHFDIPAADIPGYKPLKMEITPKEILAAILGLSSSKPSRYQGASNSGESFLGSLI